MVTLVENKYIQKKIATWYKKDDRPLHQVSRFFIASKEADLSLDV